MEIDFLKRIVKEAEKISTKHFDIYQKDDKGDLVTNLDKEIEQFFIDEIHKNYPRFDIVSEEFNSDGTVTDNCFIIDPIDGTINFANGMPLWCIQIACRKNGETTASVISLPKLGEFYYADQTGAYLNDQKITVKEVPIKNTLYAVVGRNNLSVNEKMRTYSRNNRNVGSIGVAYSFLASGRFHGISFRVENPWDYEPGMFLCKMAGAVTKNEKGFHAAAMNQEFLDLLEKETAFTE